jgi:PAS domain-containing protein
MSPRRRPANEASISHMIDQRRQLLARAVNVLDTEGGVATEVETETLRETAGLLALSLEELRVAEETLVQQNEELHGARAAIESTSRHYHRLFDDMPLPYVVTDICGIIQHANRAAAALLKRDQDLLERKPLVNFVPSDRRSGFRDAINRLRLVDSASDWRVTMLRQTDGPIDVSIEVRRSPGERDGEELICWILRPVDSIAPAE